MPENTKNELVKQARFLSEFFSIDVTIKLFGREIFHFTYPPLKKSKDE